MPTLIVRAPLKVSSREDDGRLCEFISLDFMKFELNDSYTVFIRTPIVAGRVGIRCVYCKQLPFNERASQSTAFPSNLDKIYSAVVVSMLSRLTYLCHTSLRIYSLIIDALQ